MVNLLVAQLGHRYASAAAGQRVLAENVHSSRDIPGFDNSAMDGYAVRAADIVKASEANPVRLTVLETVAAGRMPTSRLKSGEAARTMTGAPIAEGADAIVQIERTRGSTDFVEILAAAEAGAFIRPRGEDLRAGELERLVVAAHRVLRAAAIAGVRTTTGERRPGARLWVYRRAGRPCRRCGTRIELSRQGEFARLTFWCPACQRAPA